MATPADLNRKMIDLLNGLVHLDYDAIEAYEAAIDRLGDLRDKDQLRIFLADHQRHTRDLGEVVRSLGGEPASGADFQRVLTKGKVVLGALAGDRAILQAMKSNEDTTNRRYEQALRSEGLTAGIRDLLARNLSDERRHRAWIEERLTQKRSPEATF